MRGRQWVLGVAGLGLAAALAGCGATVSVHTAINPNGSGTITWTAADSANDIQSNGNMTVPQATALLQQNAPPGASVSGPTVQNGNEVWTITDNFASIAQLNTILQAATGASNFQAVTMSHTGVPWATTYNISDPDNGSGNQWNWVTNALQKAGNSNSSDWTSGSSTDTLTIPWITSPGIPTYHELSNRNGQSPNFGIQWYRPQYTMRWQGIVGAHPHLSGTWAMSFSAIEWQLMPTSEQAAIKTWWKDTDPKAHFALKKGQPTWTAHVTLKPGKNGPWGTLKTHHHVIKSTFWRTTNVSTFAFVPNRQWLMPAAWVSNGLRTSDGWNGTLEWRTDWAMPLSGKLLQWPAQINRSWNASPTWTVLRWAHVAEVGGGILVVLILALVGLVQGRRRVRRLIRCAQCGRRNAPTTKFCTGCGQALAPSTNAVS